MNNKGKPQMYDGIAIRWSKDWRLKVIFYILHFSFFLKYMFHFI